MRAIVTGAKAAVALLGWLVLADLAGVVVLTVLDILPLRFMSGGVAYAVWLVLGIFCGIGAYNTGGRWALPLGYDDDGANDWIRLPRARQVGTIVTVTGILVIGALCALFNRLYWSWGVAGEYYVPDSPSHSLVFFASVLTGIGLSRWTLMPGENQPGSSAGNAP
jgi:hypothetical protein